MSEEGRGPSAPLRTGFLPLIAGLDEGGEQELFRALSLDEARGADGDWPSWAHEGQMPPSGAWRTWVIMAGRGFGKTRAGAEWVTAAVRASGFPSRGWEGSGEGLSFAQQALPQPLPQAGGESEAGGKKLQIALVAATLDEARRVMVEGRSGLLNVAADWIEDWHPSLRKLVFTTGAEATLFSGASPEALRGPEHHIAWCDELAKWEQPEASWDMLQLGLRLGDHPRALVTTTPRPGAALERIMAEADTVTIGGRSRENPHLPAAWLKAVERMYAGTRLGRQELEGELLGDRPGQLWTVELIERCRLKRSPPLDGEGLGVGWPMSPAEAFPENPPPPNPPPSRGRALGEFTRLVIAVDPPAAGGTCGIVACAKDEAGIAHVLADHSVTGRSPDGWARAVADAAAVWAACVPALPWGVQVIAEKNQGGEMVKAILLTADPGLKVKLVTATRDKPTRAAPIAHLFEAGKVVLHGRFEALEKELLGMVAGEAWRGPGTSPDRADAMVWGIAELMLGKERGEPRVVGF